MAGVKGKSGRTAGTPNKATREAREAIAEFVNRNAGKLQDWLDKVARGEKDEDGAYIVLPNPEKAFNMFQSVIEYHVPKLARTETTGVNGGPIETITTINVRGVAPGGTQR